MARVGVSGRGAGGSRVCAVGFVVARSLAVAFGVLCLVAGGHVADVGARPYQSTFHSPFLGLVSEDAFATAATHRNAILPRIAASGATTLRQTLDWSVTEPRRNHHNWSAYDAWMASTARAGLTVLPILFNPPRWASSKPRRGAKRGTYPPRRNADFARFAAAAARRYGPSGTFWAHHPELPKMPITAWQIWNEPNLPVYWQPRPSARRYVALLRAASRAIKHVDRHAMIVTAGLPQSRLGIPLTTFIRQMYAARARSAFDALAVNPYARTPGGVLAFLRRVRRVMDARHDRAGRIWATEIGWSDTGPKGAFRLGPRGQAAAIAQTLPALWRARRSLKLQGVVYFNWRDAKPYPGGKDFWGLHTGLLDIHGQPKPAYYAFRDAAQGLR